MAETRIVCSKCGKSEEFGAALASGWLYHQRAGEPEGYLVIRCPQHISEHARRLAGLPQQNRSKRVRDNLERGLWAYFGGGEYIAEAWVDNWSEKNRAYGISYFKGEMPAHETQHYATLDELITAMRCTEPDLRRWRLCEAG